MGIKARTAGIKPAGERLERVGLGIMRESANEGQRVARSESRVDTGNMRESIQVQNTPDGAVLLSDNPYISFHEHGTGLFRDDGTGRKSSWVYFSNEYGFVTTHGVTPSPMFEPGFRAAVAEFSRQKRARGL